MNITQIENFPSRCTGCHACYNVCPYGAIEMKPDEDGFLMPSVLADRCKDCSLCVNVCAICTDQKGTAPQTVYETFATDPAECRAGASGGIFGVIASEILRQNGTVYGAAEVDGEVRHIAITQLKDLDLLRRSKYVQSRIGSAFRQIQKQLKNGETVFFTGTPCQVQGLRNYLRKDYDNLLTMDFVCHGVPSPKLYQDFKKEYRAESATFREKRYGWRHQNVCLYRNGACVKTVDSHKCFYYLAFVYSYALRRSCYTCMLPENHFSDLTVGDLWNTRRTAQDGVSQLCINTPKGKQILEAVASQLDGAAIGDLSCCRSCYADHSTQPEYDMSRRDAFYACYRENGFRMTEKKYMRGELKHKIRPLWQVLRYKIRYWMKKR